MTASGWATFSGAAVSAAEDEPTDGNGFWRPFGGELTGASLTLRPEEEDFLVRLRLASLPPRPVPEVMVYVVWFRANGQFLQYQCHSSGCTSGANVFGTVGNEVWMRIPAPPSGAKLEQVKAFVGQRNPATGLWGTLDEAALPDAVMPAPLVDLGVASAGTPVEEVAFDTPASLDKGRFTGGLDALPGPYDVWARACLGQTCRTASVGTGG